MYFILCVFTVRHHLVTSFIIYLSLTSMIKIGREEINMFICNKIQLPMPLFNFWQNLLIPIILIQEISRDIIPSDYLQILYHLHFYWLPLFHHCLSLSSNWVCQILFTLNLHVNLLCIVADSSAFLCRRLIFLPVNLLPHLPLAWV